MPARLMNIALGVWLMAAPGVLGYGDPARTNDWIVGPLVVAFATVAIWEVTRALRWVNLMLGLWLLAAPWLLGYAPAAAINSMLTGGLVAAASLVRGRLQHKIGGGWSYLWRGAR